MTKEGPLSYKEKTEIPSRQDHEFYRAGHAPSIRTDFFFQTGTGLLLLYTGPSFVQLR